MNALQLTNILKAYATVLFLQSPVAGFIILLCTMINPNIGLAGLLAAIIAFTITRLWQFPEYASHIQIFNSLLVGLSIGAFYQLNGHVIGIIILGAILTCFVATVLADWTWRLDRLPVMSLPFVIVAGLMALVARHYTELSDYLGLALPSSTLFTPSVDAFFSSLGAIYFTPTPLAGLILFLVIAVFSRYLAMLAVTGYITGYLFLTAVLFEPHPGFVTWVSFNFILVAIALGGVFTIPGIASLIFAMIGVLLSALLVIATQGLILTEGLPIMAVSFVVTTLTLLMAMKRRMGLLKPHLAPEPGMPEANYEKARLAKYRNGEINSVPLLAPVFGAWTIYQGFNGKHTHQPPWHYALDFFIKDNDKSYRNDGEQLEDFLCYGAPVLSPAHGDVVRTSDRLPDNVPGEVDTKNNWGNFILIRLDSGLHLLLAHLQQGSIKVREGERIIPGKILAACGNTGRSPQPHLHMQVQRTAELGGPTCPFHLCSLMLQKSDGSMEYKVVATPKEGERIQATTPDDKLSSQLHLPVGRELTYRLTSKQTDNTLTRKLTVELTLLGQFRLTSDTRASMAFEETNGVLAFYDRKGPKDILLDMWALANGLTPLTEMAHHWRDAPSSTQLPLTAMQRFWLLLFHPLGHGLNSRYTRQWDKEKLVWVQQGTHTLLLGTNSSTAETTTIIDPDQGCKGITLVLDKKSWHAQLLDTGLIEDQGIPKRHEPMNTYPHDEIQSKVSLINDSTQYNPISGTLMQFLEKPKTNASSLFVILLLTITLNGEANADDWQTNGTAQSWWQTYMNSSERENAFNLGIKLETDYLDSDGLKIGYNHTFVRLKNQADISEHMLYASGYHHSFLDIFPGKLTLRLDAYTGKSTLSYNISNPPSSGQGMGSGNSSTIQETADIYVLQPQVAFINFSKTMYADIGYAWSKHDPGTGADTELHQTTPTIGFGWNKSYDWLQLRAYVSKLDETSAFYADTQHQSLEIKYTHWMEEKSSSQIKLVQFSVLSGKRILAVDPDAYTVYANSDIQTGSVTASVQFKTSGTSRVMALLAFDQYENYVINDTYEGFLIYVNIQQQW